ncbi:MAG: nickel permease [Bacteroidetes bacterium]|nr:nickel permease [Bacteroidota bacterium]
MEIITIDFSGVVLMLALGLRHGLDPDHIAIIDGMTMRHNDINSPFAKWVGTLFAIGHGLVVTIIAILVSLASTKISLPLWISSIAEWIPVILLLLVGFVNLKSLMSKNSYKAIGWRTKLIPNKLKNSSSPLSIILIGVLFATVFDTATQASAWGYAASLQGGVFAAVLMGLIFSAGMIATDTIDGRILYSILNKTSSQSLIVSYRRWIGWTIVSMSFTIAGYKIASAFFPTIELSSTANSLIGLTFMLFVMGIYIVTIVKNSKASIN